MIWWIVATEGVSILLSFGLGVWARPFLLRNRQDLAELMDRIVNAEGAEEQRNAIRRQLHDAGRRTMRTDGGAPAKVHRMRARTRRAKYKR